MGELVLYDSPSSSNALKVRFALAELELPYERRRVPIARPRPDWYLAVNPRGLIPTLLDGSELVLAESHAILRYLAARERRDDLYPVADGASRARIDEFLDWFATGIRPAFHRHELLTLGWTAEGGLGSGATDAAAAARVAEEIAPVLRLADAQVSPDGAVLGRFTIADCALAPVLNRTRYTGLDLAPYPRLMALRERLIARPGFLAAEPVR
jgi:glutathione S-transferase